MNYCPNCGVEITGGKFCANCGMKLSTDDTSAKWVESSTAEYAMNVAPIKATNPLCVAGFVLSILPIWISNKIFIIVYLITAFLLLIGGLIIIRKTNENGLGLAVAGFILLVLQLMSFYGRFM